MSSFYPQSHPTLLRGNPKKSSKIVLNIAAKGRFFYSSSCLLLTGGGIVYNPIKHTRRRKEHFCPIFDNFNNPQQRRCAPKRKGHSMTTQSSKPNEALVKVKSTLGSFFSGGNREVESDIARQEIVNLIKRQYADLYRISAEGCGLLITKCQTNLEMFAEFDQMSGDLLYFKGWVEMADSEEKEGYKDWSFGEIELKPLKTQDGIIYCFRGTIEWLGWKDGQKTRPISARVKYEFPEGKICAFVPNTIGDSHILEKARVEYKSSELKLEITT